MGTGPPTGETIQRSIRLRSSGPLSGCFRVSARTSAITFCALGVSGGKRPSGGSTIIDVLREGTTFIPFSHQISGSATVSFVDSGRSLRAFSYAAASCSVKYGLAARSRGRSRGVANPFVQIPCRSGFPSGVRAAFQPAGGDCPAADITRKTIPINAKF